MSFSYMTTQSPPLFEFANVVVLEMPISANVVGAFRGAENSPLLADSPVLSRGGVLRPGGRGGPREGDLVVDGAPPALLKPGSTKENRFRPAICGG